MYLLFRYHSKMPSEVRAMGVNEKRIAKVFMMQELEDIMKENEQMFGGGDNV